MLDSLKLDYPIVVEKDKIRFTLNSKIQEGMVKSIIVIDVLGKQKTTKQFKYRFRYEYEALDEVFYLINENINKSVLFDDYKTETSMLDILVEFDKIKKQLTGELK